MPAFPIYGRFLGAIVFCIFLPDIVLRLPMHLLRKSMGCFKYPGGVGYICP